MNGILQLFLLPEQGKIFLGGLDNATTKETLLQYCQEWGEVTDHVLMEGRGFGFVTYADPANATQFLEVRCVSGVIRQCCCGKGLSGLICLKWCVEAVHIRYRFDAGFFFCPTLLRAISWQAVVTL